LYRTLQQKPEVASPPDQPDHLAKSQSPPDDSPTDRLMIRAISVTTWGMWFIYTCRLLPYPLLFMLLLSIITGTIIYLQKRSAIRNAVPTLTKYAAVLTMLGKSKQSSRGVSRKSSIQLKARRNTLTSPSPSDANNQFSTPKEAENQQANLFSSPPDRTTMKETVKEPEAKGPETVGFYSDETLLSPVDSNVSEDEVDGLLDSNKFMYGVLCACFVVQIWNRLWLVHLLPIPVIYFGVKKLGLAFGIHDYIKRTVFQPFVEFYSTHDGPSRKFNTIL